MKSFDALIQDLKSENSAIRDEAALKLINIGNDKAIVPLIEAIIVPENANYRGTLVYALSSFDCIDHLEYLIDLAITGNFEVSSCSFNIIEAFELTPSITDRIKKQLANYNIKKMPYKHSLEAYQALFDLISN